MWLCSSQELPRRLTFERSNNGQRVRPAHHELQPSQYSDTLKWLASWVPDQWMIGTVYFWDASRDLVKAAPTPMGLGGGAPPASACLVIGHGSLLLGERPSRACVSPLPVDTAMRLILLCELDADPYRTRWGPPSGSACFCRWFKDWLDLR